LPAQQVSGVAKLGDAQPTLAHYLIYLAILLPTDKFLVLIRKLDLDTNLVLSALDEWYLMDDHHGSFDCVVRSVNGEGKLVEANLSTGICADIRKHCANVSRRGSPHGSRLGRLGPRQPP